MCSTNGGQLGRICRAIDELAASSSGAGEAAGRAARAEDAAGGAAGAAGPGEAARETGGLAGAVGPAAAAHRSGTARAGAARRGERENADIARLAAIWKMVADADPELAKRLPGYLSASE